MTTLAERLTEIMADLEIETPTGLATFCGVSGGLVTQWFTGQTKLGAKPLKAFARTQYSLDWITTGKLPKYRDGSQLGANPLDDRTDKLVELILHFHNSDERGQENILSMARGVAKRNRTRWERVSDALRDSPGSSVIEQDFPILKVHIPKKLK